MTRTNWSEDWEAAGVLAAGLSALPRRPKPNREAPEGYVWRAVVADDDWTTRPDVVRDRLCRFTEDRIMHGAPAAAVLFRGRHRRPYGYCAEHLYGRWIEDGKVMGWRPVPVLP